MARHCFHLAPRWFSFYVGLYDVIFCDVILVCPSFEEAYVSYH